MQTRDEYRPVPHHDKQLRGISLEDVLAKRQLDQALNAKEFAVCAGISYSTARHWFHLPDFPAIHGVVFWQDFVKWRSDQNVQRNAEFAAVSPASIGFNSTPFPPRATQLLHDA